MREAGRRGPGELMSRPHSGFLEEIYGVGFSGHGGVYAGRRAGLGFGLPVGHGFRAALVVAAGQLRDPSRGRPTRRAAAAALVPREIS